MKFCHLLLSAVLLSPAALHAQTLTPGGLSHQKTFTDPAWMRQGIVMSGDWEGLAFRARKGGQGEGGVAEDLTEQFQLHHTREVALNLKRTGITLVHLNFYKTGLTTDGGDIEVTRKFMRLCKEQGIRVDLYIGGTIFADTLLHNMPEAEAWVNRDETGAPLRYMDAAYRYLPDFNHPGYVTYLQSVIHKAIVELHPDMLHFDNFSLSAPPHTASTPDVNRRFREFIEKKFTPAQRQERFGFSDVSGILVPTWKGISNPETLSPLTDPVVEEWIDFRCGDLAEYYGKIADYARSLDPNIAIELNPHGIYGNNRSYLYGIDHARLVPHGSAFWTEEENDAQVTDDGILISKIRSYKLATHLGETLLTSTGPSPTNSARHSYLIQLAESMAFNRNCLGLIGENKDAINWPPDLLKYIRFYHDQNQYFQDRSSVADVAILRSFPSLSFNSKGPQLQVTLMEQLLIQYKIPFDYVLDADLQDLSRYHVLILADQEALSDVALEQIGQYVRNGGGLVSTGATAQFTEWHRTRIPARTAGLLGFSLLQDESQKPLNIGKGKVVYLDAVIPALGYPNVAADGSLPIQGDGYRNSYWKLPRNSDQIVRSIQNVSDKPLSIIFANAPLTTIMQLTTDAAGDQQILHWVNFDSNTKTPATRVSLLLNEGRHATSVKLVSPDQESRQLAFSEKDHRLTFELPQNTVYEMGIISLSPSSLPQR